MEYGKKVIRMNKRQEQTRALCGHVILSLTNIFSQILPTADEPKVSAAFVFSWVTAETQRSREKAKRATQTVQHRQGTSGTTLLSLKTVNRRRDEFQLSPVFKQHKSLCLSKSGLLHFVLFFFFLPFVG